MSLPRRSPALLGWFLVYVRRYARRHFRAVRLARPGAPAVPPGPLLIVLNHPSWWDPLVCGLLSERFPGRAAYAPIESQALGRYKFFERLGLFGVDPTALAGARDFLTKGREVLARPDAALWVTAQGHFADVRARPAGLRPGVAHLARRLRGGTVLPLALEYLFWNERLPEALALFGEPVPVEEGTARSVAEWLSAIDAALVAAQDRLAALARARNPADFESVVSGAAGVGGFYDVWRSLKARLRGDRFRPEHDPSSLPEHSGQTS